MLPFFDIHVSNDVNASIELYDGLIQNAQADGKVGLMKCL